MKRSRVIILLSVLFVLCIVCAIGFQSELEITEYTLKDSRIPEDLDGYKIVQISDLHNKTFGAGQQELVSAIESCSPDLIVLTGDMYTQSDTNFDNVRSLLLEITTIAPVYSVSGNHEYLNYELYTELRKFYQSVGVLDLVDETVIIEVGDTDLLLHGINQEHCHALAENDTSELHIPTLQEDEFGIILYHFANQFDALAPAIEGHFCVFSGHTHGGIIRLPGLGGLISNDLSLFPPYDGGVYEKNGTYLISSRGLGDAFIPRFNNNPEVVCVTLECEKD